MVKMKIVVNVEKAFQVIFTLIPSLPNGNTASLNGWKSYVVTGDMAVTWNSPQDGRNYTGPWLLSTRSTVKIVTAVHLTHTW